MSRKAKKDDAAKLEAAQDAPDETGAVATDAPGDAGTGPAGEAPASDAPAGDEVAAAAAPDGEVPGAADADAHATDGEKPEAEAEIVGHDEATQADRTDERSADAAEQNALAAQDCGAAESEADQPDAAMGSGAATGSPVQADGGDATESREKGADPDDGAEDHGDRAGDSPKNLIGINVLAAYAAASVAFGTTEEDDTTLPRFDLNWLASSGDHKQAAECAAALARRTIGAPPETMVIHLRRNGFPDTPAATGRVEAAWRIFLSTLAELDRLYIAEAEAAKYAALAALAGRGPRPALRADLAMAPADPNPLTDLGRRLQRGG